MQPSVAILTLPEIPSAATPPGSPNLLYWTIYQGLVQAIEADPDAVGKDVPIERLISAHYSASRFTVRQALDLLEKRGYIRKQRAKPARVISRSPVVPVERHLRTLSDILRPSVIHLSQVSGFATVRHAEAAAMLQQDPDTPLLRMQLVHSDQAQNIGFSDIYFPPSVAEKLSIDDFESAAQNGPLFVYPIVERQAALKVDHARISIGADPHSRASRTALADSLGTAPLVRVQYVFSSNGLPVQFTTNWLDSRFFSVSYELTEGQF